MPTIDTSGYVSEFTKNTLEQFGWQKGDPLLQNTGEIIQQIRERTPAAKKAGVIIDATLMSEQDIQLMRSTLAAAKQQHEIESKKQKINQAAAGLAPGVQEAYKKLAEMQEDVSIVDDRNKPEEKTDTQTEETAVAAPDVPAQKLADPPPKTGAPVSDASAESGVKQPDALTTIEAPQPAFCPRCEWDLRQNYDVKIDEVDKENFLITILSGTRFKKNYAMLNGKYTVIFRTLLAEENRKIHRQLVLEQRANEFFSDTEWFLKFFEYRLACSVESIVVDGKVIAVLPTLDELGVDRLPATADDPSLPGLIRMHNCVIKELFGAEITRRLVSKHFREFQRLYEALEAMALEPNFW